jgi:hypothetical protein
VSGNILAVRKKVKKATAAYSLLMFDDDSIIVSPFFEVIYFFETHKAIYGAGVNPNKIKHYAIKTLVDFYR